MHNFIIKIVFLLCFFVGSFYLLGQYYENNDLKSVHEENLVIEAKDPEAEKKETKNEEKIKNSHIIKQIVKKIPTNSPNNILKQKRSSASEKKEIVPSSIPYDKLSQNIFKLSTSRSKIKEKLPLALRVKEQKTPALKIREDPERKNYWELKDEIEKENQKNIIQSKNRPDIVITIKNNRVYVKNFSQSSLFNFYQKKDYILKIENQTNQSHRLQIPIIFSKFTIASQKTLIIKRRLYYDKYLVLVDEIPKENYFISF